MDKSSIAVGILSLATHPDRAATTVGDFSEESATHEPMWFWRQMARTLGAHIVHDFIDAPGRLLLSCVAGATFFLSAYLVLFFSMISLSSIWSGVYYSFVPKPPGNYLPAPPGQILVPAVYIVTALIATGQCIARVSRRPLAAWVLWVIGCAIIWSIIAVITHQVPDFPTLFVFVVLLGAIWERRRALKIA